MNRDTFFLVLILLVASILRLWLLGEVPKGVTNDEMGYIYNAYSIAESGKNIFGQEVPLFTWVNISGFPFMPVPTYILVPFFWMFGLSAFVGRLPSALLGIADVFLVFVIVRQLFKNNSLAFLSALFLAISPWHLHFSRSAYDPNMALFFYLLGICLFFFEIKRKRLPILTVVSFFIALYSYRGMNVVYIPLIILLGWYGVFALKMTRKQLMTLMIGVFISLLSLFIVINHYGKSYTAEAEFYKDPQMQEFLDRQIRESNGPLFVRRVYLNKVTYTLGKLRENYIKGYSPEFLFLYSESNQIYSIWSRGRIFFIDVVFILLGIAYVLKARKKEGVFVLVLLVIGGLPGMIGGLPYSARNFLLSAVLPMLAAGGILYLISYAKKLKPLIIIGLITIYVYIFGSYLFDYYGRYAYAGSEFWYKSLGEVAQVIDENEKSVDNVVVGTVSFPDLVQYAFYAELDPQMVQESWKNRETQPFVAYSINGVMFTNECREDEEENLLPFAKRTLYIVHDDCAKEATPSAYIRDHYLNTIWKIYKE